MKRPPRQVWLVVGADGSVWAQYRTQREAKAYATVRKDWQVAGPYVLAERVRQR